MFYKFNIKITGIHFIIYVCQYVYSDEGARLPFLSIVKADMKSFKKYHWRRQPYFF